VNSTAPINQLPCQDTYHKGKGTNIFLFSNKKWIVVVYIQNEYKKELYTHICIIICDIYTLKEKHMYGINVQPPPVPSWFLYLSCLLGGNE
jgi:hypothetical protein